MRTGKKISNRCFSNCNLAVYYIIVQYTDAKSNQSMQNTRFFKILVVSESKPISPPPSHFPSSVKMVLTLKNRDNCNVCIHDFLVKTHKRHFMVNKLLYINNYLQNQNLSSTSTFVCVALMKLTRHMSPLANTPFFIFVLNILSQFLP